MLSSCLEGIFFVLCVLASYSCRTFFLAWWAEEGGLAGEGLPPIGGFIYKDPVVYKTVKPQN